MNTRLNMIVGLLCFANFLYSQSDSTTYFDKKWKETTKINASFYQIVHDLNIKQKEYKVTGYYITGEKKWEGTISNLQRNLKSGKCTNYYKNGKISGIEFYKKNKKVNAFEYYYPNGQISYSGEIVKNEETIKMAWDSTGRATATNGEGYVYFLNDSDIIEKKCEIKNGLLNGQCIGCLNDCKYKYVDIYEKNKLISGELTDSMGIKYSYNKIMIDATFDGGPESYFLDWLKRNISKPGNLGSSSIRSKVMSEFDINENGELVNIHLTEPSDYDEINIEVIKALQRSPKWKPAYYRGFPVSSHFTIPIEFNLKSY